MIFFPSVITMSLSYLYLFSILFFVLSIGINAENPIRTPNLIKKSFTGCTEKDDFKSDPEDCTLFHRCAYGYQYTYVCPDGTGFDYAKRVCNYIIYVPECNMMTVELTTPLIATTSTIETTSLPIQTFTEPIIPVIVYEGCKFNLSDFERGIFCNSATFRSFYPLCCKID